MSTPSPLPADYVHAPIVVREAARLHIERAPAAKGRAWLEKALADAGVTGKFTCFLSLAPISSSNVSQTSSIWSFVGLLFTGQSQVLRVARNCLVNVGQMLRLKMKRHAMPRSP